MITRILALTLVLVLLPLSSQAANKTGIACKLSADKTVVAPGEKVVISWTSSKSIVSFGPGDVKIAPFGSMEVTPTKKTIYKFKFVGIGGNEKCGIRIRMQGEQVPA